MADRQLVGLGMTLREYCDAFLPGRTPYFETVDLEFECTQCGQCCERPGVIYLEDEDVDRIAAHLALDPASVRADLLSKVHGEWVIKVTKSRQCRFYVDKKCVIHEIKPAQCRSYPFWPENVCTRREWRAAKRDCEGIGRGDKYSAADVRAILDGSRGS